jgi:hypothetical protein
LGSSDLALVFPDCERALGLQPALQDADGFRGQREHAHARAFSADAHLRFAEQQIAEPEPEHFART